MGLLDKILGGKPSREKFANMFVAALKNAGDQRVCQLDSEDFRLLFTEEGENRGVLNLTNLYAEFCKVGKPDRKRALSEMVRAALSHLKEMPTDFADASYDIRPRLWTRSTYEQLRLKQLNEGGKEIDWPMEPIGEHLILSLVYDLPESVRSISNDDLEEWGVSYWEAREVAIRNLEDTKIVYASLGSELYASNTSDSYDATRLILTELLQELDVQGQPIAMVPNRETLLISGTDSEVGQKMMLEFAAQQLAEQPRPMIATPLILAPDGEWHDWHPPKDNPYYKEYRKLEIGFLATEYGDQKSMLDQINEQKFVDEFVASYSVASKEDDFHSYSVWTRDVVSVLPKTDVVAFFDTNTEESILCPWDAVCQEVGFLMEELDYYPVRYRVTSFPSDEALEKLKSQQWS